MATRIVSAWAVIVALAFPLVAQEVLPSPVTVIRGTDNRSIVDLMGDQTSYSYGLRVIRETGGDNASSGILHRGTGGFFLIAVDASSLNFRTTNTDRWSIGGSSGHFIPGADRTYDAGASTVAIRDTFSQRLIGEEIKIARASTSFGTSFTLSVTSGINVLNLIDPGSVTALQLDATASTRRILLGGAVVPLAGAGTSSLGQDSIGNRWDAFMNTAKVESTSTFNGLSTFNAGAFVNSSFTVDVGSGASYTSVAVTGVYTQNSSGATFSQINRGGWVNVSNEYRVNGTSGQTGTYTVRDAAGTGTCTLVFTGGIKTGGTC